MPCQTYTDHELYEQEVWEHKRTEALLCLVMRTIQTLPGVPDERGISGKWRSYELEARCGVTYVELNQWWVDHKAKDEAREAEEKARNEKRALKERVLAKLSEEERVILGFK